MFKRSRLIAAAAVIGALATAGPIASAGAATTGSGTPGSGIACYPLPAFCGTNGQPAVWAPLWVYPALGLPLPSSPFGPITMPAPITFPPAA